MFPPFDVCPNFDRDPHSIQTAEIPPCFDRTFGAGFRAEDSPALKELTLDAAQFISDLSKRAYFVCGVQNGHALTRCP